MKYQCSKHYEVELYWEKGWGFGFWIMRGWFGAQCFSAKIVISKKGEPIELIKPTKHKADLFKWIEQIRDMFQQTL